MKVEVFSSSTPAVEMVARKIIEAIKSKNAKGQPCVLGLATGSTPIRLYARLVQLHKQGEVSFANVITFNLDEYYPIQPDALQSYVRYMNENLFSKIDIKKENVNIPDGTIPRESVGKFCDDYEKKIEAVGGLDLQILGIGRSGHIGFNEPGSSHKTRTRLVTLDYRTRNDAAGDFFGIDNVPYNAITMGIATIMKAKSIILMAWGEGKAPVIAQAVEGPVTDEVPSTFLQTHDHVTVALDDAAASELTRSKAPWKVVACNWKDQRMILKAVVSLSLQLKKAILKLSDTDFMENSLSDLLTEYETPQQISKLSFNILKDTIRENPFDLHTGKKRILILAPRPADDVIAMGGTIVRLLQDGHEITVCYQTSGNIGVSDVDALKYLDFVSDYNEFIGVDKVAKPDLTLSIKDFIQKRNQGEIDKNELLRIKAFIRRGEAKAACRYLGIPTENCHFLDLPFYETGEAAKKPLGEEDVKRMRDFLSTVRPDIIFAGGERTDPHGTSRICSDAFLKGMTQLKGEAEHADWVKKCQIWMYRGAWQEWSIEEVDMGVPLWPTDLLKKRNAIFKHQTQKDNPLFPSSDRREFWAKVEERNKNTASLYNLLGFYEYEAIEAFVKHPDI